MYVCDGWLRPGIESIVVAVFAVVGTCAKLEFEDADFCLFLLLL